MVMMQAVMFPPIAQKVFRGVQLMNCVMNNQVSGVTGRKSGKKYQTVISENKTEEKEEYNCQCHRNKGRHHQPVFVFGVLVMHAMNGILYLFLSFSFCMKVVNK